MDILSIVLGVLSLATAFTPFIWLQVIGGFVGIAGIVLARKAKKADYRKDLTTARERPRRRTIARTSPRRLACCAPLPARCSALWPPSSRW